MTVVPSPASSTLTGRAFGLARSVRIEYGDLFSAEAFRIACRLRDNLADRFGLRLEVSGQQAGRKGRILLGTVDEPGIAAELKAAGAPTRHRMLRREGYVLAVNPGSVIIAGFDSDGLFHGVQTFLQLIERRGQSLRVPCGRHLDAPAHDFRGVHLYVPPKTEIAYFKRLIRFLAAGKVNVIVLEIAAAMEFRRHPEMNRAWEAFTHTARKYPFPLGELSGFRTLHGRGKDSQHYEQGGGTCISQDDMRAIVRCARENHIEIIPEVQSPGHTYWMCLAHPEVAEWKEDEFPDTFCTSNPRSYELLFDVMEEVIDVIEPRWLHSGNDEYYFYGICPKCRDRTGHEILADHINKVNDFLRARGLKHLMWSDKLLNPDECEKTRYPEWGTGKPIRFGGGYRVLRDSAGVFRQRPTWKAVDRIPDDVLMADWYYGMSPDTERYFAKHGKEVIFGNFGPFAFVDHPHRLYEPNVRGAEYSSWIENGEMSLAHSNWPLMAAICGDVLWSEMYRKADPRDQMDRFMEFWAKHRDMLNAPEDRLVTRRPEPPTYEKVDLGAQESAGDAGCDVPAVRRAARAYHVPFDVAAHPIVLRPGDTRGHTVEIGKQLRGIVWLWGVTVRGKDVKLPSLYEYGNYNEYYLSREVGAFTMRRTAVPADARRGVVEGRVPIRLGFEIGSLYEPMGMDAISRPTFCDALKLPDGNAVYAFEWVNPNPDNIRIEDITLMRGRSCIEGDIVVFAGTLML